MFDHVTLRVSDLEASRRFYTEALGTPNWDEEFVEWGDFGLAPGGHTTRGLHVAFGAPSRAAVAAWWKRLVGAGWTSDGEPGERPEYHASYYGAFVLDPDGNSIEAVHHHGSREGIDHLWLRSRDLAAARRFYESLAPVVGLRLVHDSPERVRFTDGEGSFTFVSDGRPATECAHLAFRAGDFETVDAFHRTALEAGARSNGEPGLRPRYHPGYYAAFAFDPDGHNVEAVFHKR